METKRSRSDREFNKFVELDNEQTAVRVSVFNQLITEEYDAIFLTYDGDDISKVEYKLNGELVATLNLAYSNGNLISVEKE